MRFDRQLAAPVPGPNDLEKEVAAALRSREYDEELIHFWARRAFELEGREVGETSELDELDRRWCQLRRAIAEELITEAAREAKRIAATIATFPEADRAMAWTEERAALGNPRVGEKLEREYREELLGTPYDADVSWLTRLGAIEFAGEELKSRVLEQRWERLSSSGRRLHDPASEEAIAREPARDDLRLVHADWLQTQPGGAGLGRFIRLAVGGPAMAWRAALFLELDDTVLGAFAFRRAGFVWERGLIRSADVDMHALRALLEHPAAFMIESATIEQHGSERISELTGAGPFRLKKLIIRRGHRAAPPTPLNHVRTACPGVTITIERT